MRKIFNIGFKFLALGIFASLFISCANQLPPSGGEDDKTPPKVIKVIPANNSVRFTGKSIKFYFDEYVNRRSFEDAFKISPLPKGRPEFDWGAKDVEVIYDEGFDKNKTYSIVITKEFKDINGSNSLTSPINFAFSTGERIDKGGISGKIFAESFDRMLITCYIVTSQNENNIKPDTIRPDYVTQPDDAGVYSLSNLPDNRYRLFAFNDDNRDLIYNKNVEKIAVLPYDVIIKDSVTQTGNNFLFKNLDFSLSSKEFFQSLKSDSLGIVYTSIENNAVNLPLDSRFYFYFKNVKVNKLDIADNLKLIDSTNGANVKLAFNWINDSLLQVFPAENLKLGRAYEFNLKTSQFSTRRIFRVSSESEVGTISGSINVKDSSRYSISAIIVQLINKQNPLYRYSFSFTGPSAFKFESIPQGDYILFAFIDLNNSGNYDYGNYFPFQPSEPFFIFDKDLKAKGMWNTENVTISF